MLLISPKSFGFGHCRQSFTKPYFWWPLVIQAFPSSKLCVWTLKNVGLSEQEEHPLFSILLGQEHLLFWAWGAKSGENFCIIGAASTMATCSDVVNMNCDTAYWLHGKHATEVAFSISYPSFCLSMWTVDILMHPDTTSAYNYQIQPLALVLCLCLNDTCVSHIYPWFLCLCAAHK